MLFDGVGVVGDFFISMYVIINEENRICEI